MSDAIEKHIESSLAAKQGVRDHLIPLIESAASQIVECLKRGNKVFFFGNGGSASDSQHLAAEFVGRFEKERKGLPAIALTTDTSILTAVGNDYAFDRIFSRQIEALGKHGDVAVGISTSGNSANVNLALKTAQDLGIATIGFSGKGGGELANVAQLCLTVPSEVTSSIQEAHIMIGHILCRLVDVSFASSSN